MDIKFRGIINRISGRKVYISVVNQFEVEVDLVFQLDMFAQWDSVQEGDFLIYRIWHNDLILNHSVSKVEPPTLDENTLNEIDKRCSELFLD